MTDAPAEQPGVDHCTTRECSDENHHRRHSTGHRLVAPPDETAKRNHTNCDRNDVRLVSHLFVLVNDAPLYSRKTTNRVLCGIAGLICNDTSDRSSNEHHEGGTPQNIGRPEIRSDEQRQREQ